MPSFDPQAYGPTFAELLSVDRCRRLDEGHPDQLDSSGLEGLTAQAAFAPAAIRNPVMAEACLAGVWLLYDQLDASHRISQSISNATGSFWHGIMHRREGDYSNAKYWFRNVGQHPVYEPLAESASRLADQHAAAGVLPAGDWDPMAFVDACSQAAASGSHEAFCRAVQQAEWELLFAHCYQQAVDA